MKTLYVTDLDGTLLNDESEVSAYSSALISTLSEDGALITPATARTPATLTHILAGTHIAIPAIVMTGASMWDTSLHRYINPRFIDESDCARIKRMSLLYGVNLFTYTLGENGCLEVYHSHDLNPWENRFVEERKHLKLKHFHFDSPLQQEPSLPGTILFFTIGEDSSILSLAEEMRKEIDCSIGDYLDIFNPQVRLLDIYAPGVSKAHAVISLAKDCGADRIVVFGDNLNDIPMMKVADVAVAVDNALPQVKEIANVVIGSNNDDSVARFIAEDFRKTQ